MIHLPHTANRQRQRYARQAASAAFMQAGLCSPALLCAARLMPTCPSRPEAPPAGQTKNAGLCGQPLVHRLPATRPMHVPAAQAVLLLLLPLRYRFLSLRAGRTAHLEDQGGAACIVQRCGSRQP